MEGRPNEKEVCGDFGDAYYLDKSKIFKFSESDVYQNWIGDKSLAEINEMKF